MENNTKILDTNVLLDYPQIVTKESEYWIISYRVLEEIDGLKKSVNQELSMKARKAAVYISKNMDSIEFDMDYFSELKNVDDALLKLTQEVGGVLVTNDVSLKVKARLKGIKSEGYSYYSDYNGIYYLKESELGEDEYSNILAKLYQKGDYTVEDYTFSENEFLITVPLSSEETPSVFRFNGSFFDTVKACSIKNDWIGEIYPKNPEQICLVNSLIDNDVKIIYAGGRYGTGKTFLTHNYAIRELEHQKIKKIVYVPNNSYTQNTMELGALPGTLLEKITPSIGPLIDLVGFDQIQKWLDRDQLEIVPVAYIRGRNFDDSIVIVSEAENLTEAHIKLLIARCGKNTKILFDGDIQQADSAIFKDRNGLQLLLRLHESKHFAKMFATTTFTKIERSEVAEAADFLDNL